MGFLNFSKHKSPNVKVTERVEVELVNFEDTSCTLTISPEELSSVIVCSDLRFDSLKKTNCVMLSNQESFFSSLHYSVTGWILR